MSAEKLARLFHEAYERLAPSFGYETRQDTRAFDPLSPNGMLMIAVAGEVLATQADAPEAGQEAAAVQAAGATPPFGTKRAAALALYRPPFRFTHGYIYDAANQMVADQDGFEGAVETHIAARVRGWGRIGYLPDAAALQDEVGQAIADALTAYWSAALSGSLGDGGGTDE